VELAIHPDERIDAMDFLKICRQDLDRLIEQSPPIPDAVISAFEKEFKGIPNLKVPDICHGIEHTRVYDASKSRLGKITAEAAMFLKYRKAALAKELVPAMETKIEAEMQRRVEARLQEILQNSKEAGATAGAAAAQALVPAAIATANAAAEAQAEEDARSSISPLETDWRRLLTERKKILSAASNSGRNLIVGSANAEGGAAASSPVAISVVVGDGEAPPPSSSSSVAGSTTSQGPVTTEVRFS
jgi:hypothetical protein